MAVSGLCGVLIAAWLVVLLIQLLFDFFIHADRVPRGSHSTTSIGIETL